MSKEKTRVVEQLPWQRQTYEKHRARVKNATSVIDVNPPKIRPHILFDAKKQQFENERQTEIIRNNFILLKKLQDIMRRSGDSRLLRERSKCIKTR